MLVVQVLREFAVEDFFSYKPLHARKQRIFFYRQATYKVTYVEAVEFRQGWSVSTRRGREKEKKTTKEGGLSPQEGDVRKKEKKKTKEGEKVAPVKARFRVSSTKNFFFWFTSIWVLRDPSRLKYRLLQDFVYEEAMCEGSSGNGLPYAAKAVP